MLKRPLLIFLLLTALLVGSSITFLQSRFFAGIVREFLAQRVPPELGVKAVFSEFGIQLFPPAVTISNPKVDLSPNNLFSLPADSVIRAEEIQLRFQPLQMLTGQIELQEVRIRGGDLALSLEQTSDAARIQSGRTIGLQWDQLVRIRVQGIALQDTELTLNWKDSGVRLEVEARDIALSRSGSGSEAKLELQGALSSLAVFHEKNTHRVSEIEVLANILPDRILLERLSADFGTEDFEFLISTHGEILGKILEPKELLADLEIQASGELESLSRWAGINTNSLKGKLGFEGRAKTDLLKLEKSFLFEGKVRTGSADLGGWQPQSLVLEGSYESQGRWDQGKIRISSGVAQLSAGSATGGELKVGSTGWSLGQSEPVRLPVLLKEVELAQLLGPYSQTVGNLQVRWTGKADLELSPSQAGLSILADVAISGPSLSLFGKGSSSEGNLILRANQPSLQGRFSIRNSKFTPDQLRLSFASSKFNVAGEVDWSSPRIRWDLQAGGPTDLSDLLSLGGSKITGKGDLQARVHGMGDDLTVDFDTDLDSAEYIRLRFGMLHGRLSLTEGMQKLTLQGLRGRSGASTYTIQGPLDFRGEGKMALVFDMPSGRAEDFLRIFGPLTAELSWFPESLRGKLRAKGTIGGEISVKGMDIQTQIEGSNLLYFGERFRAVKFRGGLQGGRYFAEDLILIKRSGSLLGRISFGPEDKIAWKLKSQNFSLRDLDTVIRLDVPISGDLSLQSEASGRLSQLDSRTDIRLSRHSVRSANLPDSILKVESNAGLYRGEASVLGGQLRVKGSHDSKSGSQNYLNMESSHLDFTPFLVLLNPETTQEAGLVGRITGGLDLSYRGESLSAGAGRIWLSDFELSKKNTGFVLTDPASAEIRAGSFTLPQIKIVSREGHSVIVRIASEKGLWRSQVSGLLDFSILEFVFPWITQTAGGIDLDFNLAQMEKGLDFSGKADLRGGLIRLAGLDSPIENLAGRVSARSGRWALSGVQADLAQGRLALSGQAELFQNRLPEIEIVANLADNRIKAYPFQFVKVRTGRVRLSGSRFPYELSGSIVIDEALSREKLANAGQGIALKSSIYSPPVSAETGLDFPKIQLKLDVSAPSGVKFQNEFLDLEMKAQITLINTLEAPRLLGKAELVPGQGRLSFKEHVFQIQSVQVVFDNPQAIDPRFELGATSEISGTKVQLFTSGTADKYKIDLSSNPVMPESEILSLLATGRTNEDSRRLRSTNVSGIQQSEAASLILHSMDFNRDVKEKTGFQIGVGEAMDTTSGASAFRPQADAESVVAPKIVLKRQIGKRVDVSVGTTFGAGATTQREVNADLYLSPSVSVRGVWNYLEGTTTQDAGASQQGRTSYGLDLKLQKRFK